MPALEQQQLQAGGDTFLALWKPANTSDPKGVVIILPGAGETADWPQAIAPLRNKLPDTEWASLSLTLPDMLSEAAQPRVVEAAPAPTDKANTAKDASTEAKPIEQVAGGEADVADRVVAESTEEQIKRMPSASSPASMLPWPLPNSRTPAVSCSWVMVRVPTGPHATSARNSRPRYRSW